MADELMQWIEIEDFSPGIYSAPGARRVSNNIGFEFASDHPNGSLQADSYGCLPGPGGRGLIPGFYSNFDADDFSFVTGDLSDAAAQAPYVMAGFELVNFMHSFFHISAVSYYSTTPLQRLKLLRGSTNTLVRTVSGGASQHYTGVTFAPSRMATASPYTAAGQPVVAYGWVAGFGANGEAGVFPDPTAPTVDGVATFTDRGAVLAHQNRVITLAHDGSTYSMGSTGSQADWGEKINFTDPANSNTMGTQRSVFYPEAMSGYGAWGSLSANALLLIKRHGGAVLLSGDVKSPQVGIYPGVQSTGKFMCRAAVSPIGLVYGSEMAGMWAWQGGANSVKISHQLDDVFWRNKQDDARTYFDTVPGFGPGMQAHHYGDWIFVSGGWIYNLPTQSWWRLSDPNNSSRQYIWFATEVMEQTNFQSVVLYAVHPKAQFVTGTTYRKGHYFRLDKFASEWFAHSHPIRPPNRGSAAMNLREIIVVASRDALVSGTASITVKGYGRLSSATSGATATVSSVQPKEYRFLVNRADVDGLEFSILASNSTDGQPAPIVHRVRLGYTDGKLIQARQ